MSEKFKLLKYFNILQVVGLIFISSLLSFATLYHKASAQLEAELSGTVMDINEARIANAKIVVENNGVVYTTVTAEDGTYKINLPVNVYRIKVSAPGFCPTHRAAFKIQSSTNVNFNFTLLACALENILVRENGKYTSEIDRYQVLLKEEVFSMKCLSSTTPLDVLVQFGKLSRNKDITEYEGIKIEGKHLGVIVTYNLLTMHADRVHFNRVTFQFEAEGNVVIEYGNNRIQAKNVEVEFKGEEPLIRFIQ